MFFPLTAVFLTSALSVSSFQCNHVTTCRTPASPFHSSIKSKTACAKKESGPPNTFLSVTSDSHDRNRVDMGVVIEKILKENKKVAQSLIFAFTIATATVATASDVSGGASLGENAKITTGGASTLQSGRTIAITRGVNLDRANFMGQNLKGVAFQQSIVRDANFRGTNLVGSSFFDATVDGSDFEGADLTLANVEMAQFNRSNLKNAIMREMYVSGATIFEGVKDIEGSDWTDTYLRKDQTKYLCGHPTAKGTNPTTGVDTRESLMCKD